MALLGTVGLINGYATILMYSRGEVAFAMLTVILTALALYVFGSKKTYAHRYIYPGIAGMILFILFLWHTPLVLRLPTTALKTSFLSIVHKACFWTVLSKVVKAIRLRCIKPILVTVLSLKMARPTVDT